MSNGRWLELAERQCGVVTTAQLHASGLSAFARQQLAEQGMLQRRSRGVWAVAGWPDGWSRAVWESLLHAGPAAVVFRRTAAAAWGMDGMSRAQTVELALPLGHQSRLRAIHRLPSLMPADVTMHNNLPITTVGRTLADLGSAETPLIVERAVEWALRQQLVQIVDLQALAGRIRTRGGRTLEAILTLRPPGAPATESDAETLFLQLTRDAGFPDPVRQFWIVLRGRRYRIDFAWPALRLAVEIDGAAFHGPHQLPRDLRRQNQIILDGWMILRFAWDMVVRRRHEVEDDLWAAWGLRGGLALPRRAQRG